MFKVLTRWKDRYLASVFLIYAFDEKKICKLCLLLTGWDEGVIQVSTRTGYSLCVLCFVIVDHDRY